MFFPRLFSPVRIGKLEHLAKNLADHLSGQIAKAGVAVVSGRSATAADILASEPEAVVLATRVRSVLPAIPGVDGPNVVSALDVLSGQKTVGERVVIVGGGLVGCETGEVLAEKGRQVTIVRRGTFGAGMGVFTWQNLLLRLTRLGVTLLPGVTYHQITEQGITVTSKEGERRTIEADSVVVAAGAVPATELAQAIAGKVDAVYSIGDCVTPRRIADAIREGAAIALQV